jgi:hypothetical protein
MAEGDFTTGYYTPDGKWREYGAQQPLSAAQQAGQARAAAGQQGNPEIGSNIPGAPTYNPPPPSAPAASVNIPKAAALGQTPEAPPPAQQPKVTSVADRRGYVNTTEGLKYDPESYARIMGQTPGQMGLLGYKPVESPDIPDNFDELPARRQFEIAKDNGLIPESADFIPGADGSWTYLKTTVYAAGREEARPEIAELKKDTELYRTLKRQGWNAYQELLDKRQAEHDAAAAKEKLAFEKKLQTVPVEVRVAYRKGGIDAYNKALDEYNTKQQAEFKRQLEDMPAVFQEAYKKDGMSGYNRAIEKADKNMELLAGFKTKDGGYDLARFLSKSGKGLTKADMTKREQMLKDAGFSEEAIKSASYNAKLNFGQKMWQGMTPWNEEKGETATAGGVGIMAAEMAVPGVYTARRWNEMDALDKATQIALDAFTLATIVVPFVGAAGRAASAVGTAGKGVRLAAAAKGVAGEMKNIAAGPVNMIIHPVASAKTTGKRIVNLFEDIAHPGKLPEPVVTTSQGTVRLRVTEATSPAEAMAIRDTLMDLAARGERPMVEVGGQTIELARSPLMKETGGGLVHATPDIEILENAKVINRPGRTLEEQGWFLSNEPALSFTERSAFGTGEIPAPKTASGKVLDISKYRPMEVVKLDKAPIKPLNLADAKNIPDNLANPLLTYFKKKGATLYGSFNEWLKVKGAAVPNDFDIVVRNSDEAIGDIVKIAESHGYKARAVPHGVEILQGGKWVKLGDVASLSQHQKMLPLPTITSQVEGLRVETLGKQYIGQAYGSIAKDLKAASRAEKLNKSAGAVKKMIEEAGLQAKKPGIFVISPESAGKAVSSEKLYKAWLKGEDVRALVAEMERKLVVGADIPKPRQKLFTRVGPNAQRVEIWLEKPLTRAQVLKLKAQGLAKTVSRIWTEPITIKGKGPVAGLARDDVMDLADMLKRSGNPKQAEQLLRAERMASGMRRTPPALSSTTGRVSSAEIARARERLGISRGDLDRIIAERAPIRPAELRRAETVRLQERLQLAREELTRVRNLDRRAELEKEIERLSKRIAERSRDKVPRADVQRTAIRRHESKDAARAERTAAPDRAGRVGRAERPTAPRASRGPRAENPSKLKTTPVKVPSTPRVPRLPKIKISRAADTPKKTGPIKKAGEGATTWPQGFGWWEVYKGTDGLTHRRFIFGQKPPEGAQTITQGKGEAYRGIQQIGSGPGPQNFNMPMGAVRVKVGQLKAEPGGAGAIAFTPKKKIKITDVDEEAPVAGKKSSGKSEKSSDAKRYKQPRRRRRSAVKDLGGDIIITRRGPHLRL